MASAARPDPDLVTRSGREQSSRPRRGPRRPALPASSTRSAASSPSTRGPPAAVRCGHSSDRRRRPQETPRRRGPARRSRCASPDLSNPAPQGRPAALCPPTRAGATAPRPSRAATRRGARVAGAQPCRPRRQPAPSPPHAPGLSAGPGPGRPRGPGAALPAPDTKRRRGSPPHLQHGAPRAFENHRTPLRRVRHSPGLPVPPGAAAAAISSRSPAPRPRCQATPFTWARCSPRRAPPRPSRRRLRRLRSARLARSPRTACGNGARPLGESHRRPRRPGRRAAPLPAPAESEPVIGRRAAVKG